MNSLSNEEKGLLAVLLTKVEKTYLETLDDCSADGKPFVQREINKIRRITAKMEDGLSDFEMGDFLEDPLYSAIEIILTPAIKETYDK